jgi:uncharacterized protein YcbK (DUF882 family)
MTHCEASLGPSELKLTRRKFLRMSFFAASASLFPYRTFAFAHRFVSSERYISFYNVHTQESLNTIYWYKGRYLSGALAEINHLFRDYRTDETIPIDTRLLDLLWTIQTRIDTRDPFHIFSGYRSPKTNALLRKRRRGVAKNSLHIRGKAADVDLPNVRLSSLRRVALGFRAGGVGYYPRNSFVHLDVGPVRYWRG